MCSAVDKGRNLLQSGLDVEPDRMNLLPSGFRPGTFPTGCFSHSSGPGGIFHSDRSCKMVAVCKMV